MATTGTTVVFKEALWLRVLILIAMIGFLAIGALMIREGEYLIGSLIAGLFGTFGILGLRRSLVALTADAEGIVPVYVLPKGSTVKIPWAKIEKLGVATQTMKGRYGSKVRYLTIKLNDAMYIESLSALNQMSMEMMRSLGGVGLDDKGVADMYLPALALGCSPEKAIEKLNMLRSQAGAARLASAPVAIQ